MQSDDPKKLDVDIEIDLTFIKRKSCTTFQLNMSKHVEERCGKLHKLYLKFQCKILYYKICNIFQVQKET